MTDVKVKGYVRSGNTLFWRRPDGKMQIVGSSRMVGAYPKIIKSIKNLNKKEFHVWFVKKNGREDFFVVRENSFEDARTAAIIKAKKLNVFAKHMLFLNDKGLVEKRYIKGSGE